MLRFEDASATRLLEILSDLKVKNYMNIIINKEVPESDLPLIKEIEENTGAEVSYYENNGSIMVNYIKYNGVPDAPLLTASEMQEMLDTGAIEKMDISQFYKREIEQFAEEERSSYPKVYTYNGYKILDKGYGWVYIWK